MGLDLNPYINFSGQAREAMEFYRSALGGEVTVMTFGDAGAPDVPADLVMHSELRTPDGFVLFASDTPEGMQRTPGDNITISLSGDDVRLRDWFAALTEGGTVTVPMAQQMWGAEFGMLVDRFGVPWMVNLAAQA